MKFWLISVLFLLQPTAAMTPKEVHQSAIVVDLHCDALYQMVTKDFLITEKHAPKGFTPQASLETLRAGGVGAQTFAVWVPTERMDNPKAYGAEALQKFREITQKHQEFVQARSDTDIYLAHEQKKIAALLSIEGAEVIGDKAEDLKPWAKDGLVLVGLVWNRKNAFADAAQAKEKPFGGLSSEGEKLVDLAAELGVLVDISHASDESFWDVIKRTRRPVIATHSSSRAVYHHARNLDDEQIRAIRETGGVVGVNFHATFLGNQKPITIKEVADHVMHILAVGGPQVIGLGADYDGNIRAPEGLETAANIPALTEELARRGVSNEVLDLFLGRNVLRALAKAKKEPSFVPGSIAIPVGGIKATASSEQEGFAASKVLDRSYLSSWRSKPDDAAPTLKLSKKGVVPSKIALRASKEINVTISFTTEAQTFEQKLKLTAGIDGVTFGLPSMSGRDWTLVITTQETGAVEISEVVLYE